MIRRVVALGVVLLTGVAAGYDRRDWPHWTVTDCQSTRMRVLIRDSHEVVHHVIPRDPCSDIAWGAWRDPYTDVILHDPSKVDVDHLVPLQHAHEHGGAAWSRERRRAYANYLGTPWHLRAVSAAANRAKGSRSPTEWLPDHPPARCEYTRDWAVVKFVEGLSASAAERAAVREALEAYCVARPR